MPLSSGTRLGPYEITAPAGAGGMGEVYRARDTRLDRIVATKVLPAQIANHDGLRQRLEREARAISSLNHPHICTLFDVGHSGSLFSNRQIRQCDGEPNHMSRKSAIWKLSPRERR
jgi:serine/threonine protein kinase